MADNIEKIVLENEDTRVLVEAGVTEALAEKWDRQL